MTILFNKLFLSSFLLMAASLFISYPTFANQEIEPSYNKHEGVYLSFDIFTEQLNFGAAAGYQFNNYCAGEIGIRQGTVRILDHSNLEYLALKGILPFENNFALFAKIGVVHATAEETLDTKRTDYQGNGVLGALGIEFSVTENFGISLGLESVSIAGNIHEQGKEKMDKNYGKTLFNLGFIYHF